MQNNILNINTSDSEKIIVGINGKDYSTNAKNNKSQRLLPFIIGILKKSGIDFKDITEINVHTGPGSFTGLRIGVSVANAIGWSLGIPINGKKVGRLNPINIEYEKFD